MDGRRWRGRQAAGFLLLAAALLMPACSSPSFPELDEEPAHPAGAIEKETRFFAISVDGKKAGQYRMAITRRPNGTVSMAGRAQVRVSYVIYTYAYSYEGTESYQKDRLTRFQSHANDNGKKFNVSAQGRGSKLHLQANGTERSIGRDVWITSYWRLPPGHSRGGPVALLDADTGKVMAAAFRHLEDKPRPVAGKEQVCAHYQVIGAPSSPVDLWFDGQQRLVHQEFVEDGHRTVLQLTKVIRRQMKGNPTLKAAARSSH